MHRKVAIIGAGPSGIACSIQLKISGIPFFLFEKKEVAWNLKNAYLIENYPGILSITGKALSKKLKNHLKQFKIQINKSEVKTCIFNKGKFFIYTYQGNFSSDYVVVCTGTYPKRILEFEIKGKTFYNVQELLFAKNQKIAIIGSGEAAFDSALSLAKNKNVVTIFSRSSQTSSWVSKILMERVKKSKLITIRYDNKDVRSVIKQNNQLIIKRGSQEGFVFDFLLILIGREPNLPHIVPRDVKDKLYFCGSVKSGRLGQTAMAVGDGVNTAMEIIRKSLVAKSKMHKGIFA